MIQVGDWLHARPNELTCERISATQLNKHKNRVQQPFLRLMIGNLEVLVNGKKMFWALLDALFADDPLHEHRSMKCFSITRTNFFTTSIHSLTNQKRRTFQSCLAKSPTRTQLLASLGPSLGLFLSPLTLASKPLTA